MLVGVLLIQHTGMTVCVQLVGPVCVQLVGVVGRGGGGGGGRFKRRI